MTRADPTGAAYRPTHLHVRFAVAMRESAWSVSTSNCSGSGRTHRRYSSALPLQSPAHL